MKKADLERHLRQHGCLFLEEGAKHSKWLNPINNSVTTIPRHNEIDTFLARAICRQLGIEVINKR